MGALDRLRIATGSQSRALAVPEHRDPTAATTQLQYTGPGMAQVPEWDATQAIRFGYLANVIAYRCVQIIADTLASKPFRAGLALPERPNAPTEHNPQARLTQLLGPPPGGPAPKLSARKLWRWTIAQRIVTGRNAWEIETSERGGAGQVVALWPLTSAKLHAIPVDGGADWFRAFRYGRPDKLKTLQPAQVHYGWDPHPEDFAQPVSALLSARYDLSIALAADKYSYGFLKNNAVPAHIVGLEQFGSAPEFEAFKRQWASEYQGPDKVGKTHFVELDPGDDGKLSEAIWVQTLGVSQKDARLIEQHRESLSRVAIALGVPWSKLDASGRTYENADAEDEWFWSSTIAPLAADLADEVNMGLAPRLGAEVGWFDLSGVRALAGRPPVDAQGTAALVTAGIMGASEARPWFGLTGDAPTPPALPAPPANTEEITDGTNDVERGADRRGRGAAGGAGQAGEGQAEGVPPEGRREARATVDQEARRGAIWRSTDAVVRRQERIWERVFATLFAEQEAAVIGKLEGNVRKAATHLEAAARARTWADETRGPADALFDPSQWAGRTEAEVRTLFEQLASAAFARLDDHFGVSFDLEAEFAQLFIRNRANQLAGQVTDTTYQAITDALAEGVGEGESIPDLADRIRSVFADAAGRRAEVIARTEVISGFNASATAAASSLPPDVVAGAQWIATRDGRTRSSHVSADGQIVAVGQPFLVGGAGAAYPGDPALPTKETVQCRCTVAFLTPEEFDAEVQALLEAQAVEPVAIARARVALALVEPGAARFDEARFRRALVAA